MLQNKGDRNFSSHIATILQANPDAVFCSLWGDDLIAFIQQANPHGFFEKVQVIATGAGDLEILRPMGADMPDGILATFLYAFDWHPVREQENQHFVSRFVNRAGYEPTSSDVIGYIATHIVAEAIRKASSTQSDALLRALRGAHFATLLGDVLIRDFDGQATFDYNVGFTYTEPNAIRLNACKNLPASRVMSPEEPARGRTGTQSRPTREGKAQAGVSAQPIQRDVRKDSRGNAARLRVVV